jgi:DNA invertase Pin-like site-specific DNA recombinase
LAELGIFCPNSSVLIERHFGKRLFMLLINKLVFGIFAALAEFERELISERTRAGLASAGARGRKGGAPFKMTASKLRLAQAAMGKPETSVQSLCKELGISRQTLYRHVGPDGSLRDDGKQLLC